MRHIMNRDFSDMPLFNQDTKRGAYASLTPGKTGKQSTAILSVLHKYGSLTNEQISNILGIRISSVCGRINELQKAGMVAPAGIAKASSGQNVKCWKAI